MFPSATSQSWVKDIRPVGEAAIPASSQHGWRKLISRMITQKLHTICHDRLANRSDLPGDDTTRLDDVDDGDNAGGTAEENASR